MEDYMNHTYSVSNDTANGAVNTGSLYQEIGSSSITIALESISYSGDSLDIKFKASISVAEKAALDVLVLAHDGKPIKDIEQIEMKPLLAEGGKRKSDRGISFTAIKDATTTADYLITEDLQIKGGVLITEGNEIFDTVGMEIIDTTYMYAGSWYPATPFLAGIPVPDTYTWDQVAPTGVALHAYIKDFPVMPSGETYINNEAITTTPLNGLTIRISYTSTGTVNDVKCNVGILAYS